MLFVALIVLVAVVGTLATNSYDRSQYEKLFYDHITKYNLKFQDGKEFIKRLQVFADNFMPLKLTMPKSYHTPWD